MKGAMGGYGMGEGRRPWRVWGTHTHARNTRNAHAQPCAPTASTRILGENHAVHGKESGKVETAPYAYPIS